jgi:hypothetical protein
MLPDLFSVLDQLIYLLQLPPFIRII